MGGGKTTSGWGGGKTTSGWGEVRPLVDGGGEVRPLVGWGGTKNSNRSHTIMESHQKKMAHV